MESAAALFLSPSPQKNPPQQQPWLGEAQTQAERWPEKVAKQFLPAICRVVPEDLGILNCDSFVQWERWILDYEGSAILIFLQLSGITEGILSKTTPEPQRKGIWQGCAVSSSPTDRKSKCWSL